MEKINSNNHVITFKKAGNLTVAGVDGVYGGVAPQGKINMNFYVETTVIPESISISVDESGRVLKETSNNSIKDSLSTREVIASLNMDLHIAKSFSVWLTQKITELESLTK